MLNDKPYNSIPKQEVFPQLFERCLAKSVTILKTLSKKPEYKKQKILLNTLENYGVDRALYKEDPASALRTAIKDKYPNDDIHRDIIREFLEDITEKLSVALNSAEPPQNMTNELNPGILYKRTTSSKDPQWVRDIDDTTDVMLELGKVYQNKEDMKYFKTYFFCGATILSTAWLDYLVYKMADISPIAKVASILVSNAFVGQLISYSREYAQYKKASYEEMLRDCEHLFPGQYVCPPRNNVHIR